jgi:hypothetical protein
VTIAKARPLLGHLRAEPKLVRVRHEGHEVSSSRLTEEERSLIRGLSLALDEFEPFPAFFAPRRGVLQKLVEAGLAEAGTSTRPAVATTGYRLTSAGWAAYKTITSASLLIR